MKITKLKMKTPNGEESFNSLALVAGVGIAGDKKANGGDRQLCLADNSSFENFRLSESGLCIKRFMPNLLTEGVTYDQLKEGDRFAISDAIITISSTRKKCFEECGLQQQGKHCSIKYNCAFARIDKSGTISTNDIIQKI